MSDGRKVSLDGRYSPLTIVEAVLATCASQPEFLPVTLDWEPGGPYQYVGPGRGASNPVYQIITESLHSFGNRSWAVVLLSFGSGNPGIIPYTRSHYSGSNALHEQQDDMAKDDMASKIFKRVNKLGGYFRFSLQQEPQGRDLDFGIDEPSRAAAQTDLYLHNPDTARRIEDCAKATIDCSDIGQRLVSEYYTAGHDEVAETIQLRVRSIRRYHRGPTHPDTIRASELLLMIYLIRFKLVNAHEEQAELLKLYSDMLGADHPRTIDAAAGLAAICSEQGNWDGAENLQLEILEQTRRVLGRDHLDAILAAANLASTYHVRGRWGEARQLWLEVLEGRKRVLGEDHPNTVFAAECLDASFRAPKEAETARRWKLSLTRPLEEAAKSSLGATVDAESDSSYPHAS
jgi:tetratricopeptide (TPR) repeat protein